MAAVRNLCFVFIAITEATGARHANSVWRYIIIVPINSVKFSYTNNYKHGQVAKHSNYIAEM